MRHLIVVLTATALSLFLLCPAYAVDPMEKPDNSWVTVSGTVVAPKADSFLLDYGEGMITVEMDDWDWYGEAVGLLDGDQVTVYGYVDDDFYEAKTIEASSVYVKGLNTYFYASGADEEDVAYVVYPYGYVGAYITVTGTVTEVNGREFTVSTGKRKIQVDTIGLGYNPMDQFGFQKIKKGDRVRVTGNMDYDVFEKREIMADSIVTLAKDKKKGKKKGS